jgi:hypothetical protein
MADEVRPVEHYTINLKDEPGAGARALGILRDGDVMLLAAWGYPAGAGKAKLEVVPEDPDGFLIAAKTGGLDVGEPATAFYVSGNDRRGAIADQLVPLAGAGVNVIAAHAVSDSRGRFGAIIYVPAAEIQRAAAVLYATERVKS